MGEAKRGRVVTLKEISEITNLSIATVSDILNHNPKCFAGEKTKETVFKVSEKLGYHPNLLYRNLRKRETHTIGLIIPDIYVNVTVANAEIIESLAWEEGYHVFIGYSHNNPEKENALLKDFVGRRVDGIILVVGRESNDMPELRYLLRNNYPLVTIGRFENYRCRFVTTDYYAGGQMAARHLLERGCKKLAFIGSSRVSNYLKYQRKAGFKDTVMEYGMQPEEFYILKGGEDAVTSSGILIKESFKKTYEILQENRSIDGVFASNDDIALGCINAALSLGLDIPEEMAVVGFDDSPSAIAGLVPITTIHQKKEEISRIAFKMLHERIQKRSGRTVSRTIKPELVVRSSTDSRRDIMKDMGINEKYYTEYAV
jgi:DNA-binding LacI/PurR family transcriptional regulator